MMADFAAYYGSFPAPDMAWRLFAAAVHRAPRLEARAKLATLDGVRAAIAAAFGDKSVERMRDSLVADAYPVARRAPVWLTNVFAPDQGPADA